MRIGTYPIEVEQTVWVEVRIFSSAGGERRERVEAHWQENEGNNSYWEAVIGPFADADRVLYTVYSRSPTKEASAPPAEFTISLKVHLVLLWHKHRPLSVAT